MNQTALEIQTNSLLAAFVLFCFKAKRKLFVHLEDKREEVGYCLDIKVHKGIDTDP